MPWAGLLGGASDVHDVGVAGQSTAGSVRCLPRGVRGTLVIAVVAPDWLRSALVAVGLLGAVIGLGLATNAGGMAAEAALRNRGSRWVAPIFSSVPALPVTGVFVALVGAVFALQAWLADDL